MIDKLIAELVDEIEISDENKLRIAVISICSGIRILNKLDVNVVKIIDKLRKVIGEGKIQND
jgi:hypothetical protein